MNTYLDDLFKIEYYEQTSPLNGLMDSAYEHINHHVDNSLIFHVTNFRDETFEALADMNFNSFKYIFMLDSLDPPEYQYKWLKLSNIFKNHINKTYYVSAAHRNPYFKTIYFPSTFFLIHRVKEGNYKREFKKKFLSFNAAPHYHRLYLLKSLYDKKLLNDGFVSGFLDTYQKDWKKLESLPTEFTDSLTQDFLDLFPMKVQDDILEVGKLTGSSKQENDWLLITPHNYMTPVNLVTETSIYNESVFITEKTVKPILSKQLIMLIGNPSSYNYLINQYKLRNYGFDFEPKIASKPFEDKIDYYTSFLQETTLDDLIDIHKEKEDILEYNKNHVLNHFKDISYNYFLTSLKKHGIIRS